MDESGQRQEFEYAFAAYERSVALSAQSVAKDFERVFEDFGREYLLARKQRVFTTPHLSVLRVFGLTARELRHSDALAWFLRENGEHEQGDLFLRTLLDFLGVPMPSQVAYTVDREKPDRVDVSAHASGKFALFIENKIRDRKEREKQFADLVDSLNAFSERNGIPENARVAVFLTDDGRAPETGPRSAVATIIMRNMSRTELFDLFRAGLRKSPAKSPLLMQLLDNYLREIKRLV